MKRTHTTVLSALALTTLCGLAAAGPLMPPGGPVSSTYKTLTEVEPRLSIDGTNTPGDGDAQFKIVSSGSYYAVGSMTIGAGRGFLEVAASNVTIDLNGMRIAGTAGSLDGIFIAPGVSNVRILNGFIAGFSQDGIDLTGGAGCAVEGVTISSCGATGLRAGPNNLVDRCTVVSSGGDGYNLAGGAVARDSSARSCVGSGFFASGAAVMSGCVSRQNTASGFHITSGASVDRCESASNQQFGVSAVVSSDGQRITDCSIVGNTQGGVSISSSTLVKGNTLTNGVGVTHVLVNGSGNRVEGNTTRGSGSAVSIHASVVDNFVVANWHYSTNSTNGFTAINAAGNVVGPVVTSAGTIATTNPWANFSR